MAVSASGPSASNSSREPLGAASVIRSRTLRVLAVRLLQRTRTSARNRPASCTIMEAGRKVQAERIGDLDLSADRGRRAPLASDRLARRDVRDRGIFDDPVPRPDVQRSEQGVQAVPVEGLDEMVVEAGREGRTAVLLLGVAGDGDQDDRPGQLASEPGGDLVAVQAGEADVEHNAARPLAAGDLDRPMSVERDPHVVAEEPQQTGHGLGRIPIVVHDEHPGGIDMTRRLEHDDPTRLSGVDGRGLAKWSG